MPTLQVTKDQIRRRRDRVNHAKFQATTEADIQRQNRVVGGPDVQSLRKRLGMTQGQFATAFDLSPRTVQGWEQRHWVPDGAGRVLISLIAYDHEAIEALLRRMREQTSASKLISNRK